MGPSRAGSGGVARASAHRASSGQISLLREGEDVQKFSGQGLNPRHSCDSAGSLTHLTRLCLGNSHHCCVLVADFPLWEGKLTFLICSIKKGFSFIYFCLFPRAAPRAYGGSQARGRIGAVVFSLHQSHSNAGSEPRLQPTPQLTATPDP